MTLNELNDYAGQHEVIAENLTTHIICELTRYIQELKAERKSVKKKSPFLRIAHLVMNCTLSDHAHWRLKTILRLEYAEIIDIT
jgi:hypothetical protein